MKKLIILAIVLFTGAATYAQSNALKINLLSPIVKTFNFQFERVISETGSLQIGFFYTGYSPEGISFNGFGVTPEYRVYLGDDAAPDGFFVAPFFRYQTFNMKDADSGDEGTFSSLGGGVIVGRQWIFKEVVTFEAFLGPKYSSGNVEVTSGTDTFDTGVFDGFGLRAGITLGFAF